MGVFQAPISSPVFRGRSGRFPALPYPPTKTLKRNVHLLIRFFCGRLPMSLQTDLQPIPEDFVLGREFLKAHVKEVKDKISHLVGDAVHFGLIFLVFIDIHVFPRRVRRFQWRQGGHARR